MGKTIRAILKAAVYFLIYLGLQMLVGVAAGILFVSALQRQNPGMDAAALQLALQEMAAQNTHYLLLGSGVLTLLTYFLITAVRQKNFKQETLLVKNRHPMHSIVGLGIMCNFLLVFTISLLPISAETLQEYEQLSGVLGTGSIVLQFLSVGILGPIVEEIAFRGFVQTRLQKGMPIWLAICLQAAVFAAMHSGILWQAYAFVLGVIMGFIFAKYHPLWASIIFHVFFNLGNFLLVFVSVLPGYAVVIMYLLFIYLSFVLFRKIAKLPPEHVFESSAPEDFRE